MCGRFVVASGSDELVEMFDVHRPGAGLAAPSYNVAPTDRVNVVIDAVNREAPSDGSYDPENPPVLRRLEAAQWGFVAPNATDPAASPTLFNAPIETALATPPVAAALASRRAAVPATGYYVWQKGADGSSTAQFVHSPDGEMLLLAALYEWWKNPAAAQDDPDRWLLTTTLLTRASAGPLAIIHERMPVFLEPGLLEDWLDPHTPGSEELLEAVSDAAAELGDDLEFYEVSKAVASVKNNSEELLAPV
jgi:putative SOS response-associated peptidase YedK